MANTFTLIGSYVIGAGGASNFTFSSIPATYTDLKIVGSTRITGTGEGSNPPIARGQIIFNGSGGDYTVQMLYGLPNAVPTAASAGGGPGSTSFYASSSVSSLGTAGVFSSFEFYIPNYTASSIKMFGIDDATENDAVATTLDICMIYWSGTSAITSIALQPYGGGTYAQYSTAYLYGIKKS
jgi:hypothetical protein